MLLVKEVFCPACLLNSDGVYIVCIYGNHHIKEGLMLIVEGAGSGAAGQNHV